MITFLRGRKVGGKAGWMTRYPCQTRHFKDCLLQPQAPSGLLLQFTCIGRYVPAAVLFSMNEDFCSLKATITHARYEYLAAKDAPLLRTMSNLREETPYSSIAGRHAPDWPPQMGCVGHPSCQNRKESRRELGRKERLIMRCHLHLKPQLKLQPDEI